ncbi:uncharacterized protein ARMOST_13816 [Armillaria ostoyae]|uniref:Uncharacterized protein n=1 Tax=Armillaria ostoyae TaxID=47428 RepID=A0A284RNV4_ARMOS|nr:uncharacterized protein ARMOST_13816 [Armillaria ostoyae]
MPASKPLLALFISKMALWHDVQGVYWYGGRILSYTKQGAAAMAPPSTKAPCMPMTEKHIASLQSHLDLNDPFDAAVWAVATITWHGYTCLGELLPSQSKLFNTSHNVYHACPCKSRITSNGHEWINLFIPYTKTKKF